MSTFTNFGFGPMDDPSERALRSLLAEYKAQLERFSEKQNTLTLAFKEFTAHVGGTNSSGAYYILGMLDKHAGTAYIKYANTASFAAVINFALARESRTGPFTSGYLSVVTNAKAAGLHHLKFYIVSGSRNGEQHAYLAIQADEWLGQSINGNSYSLFDNLMFEGAGINFMPVDSEGYIAPNGEAHIISEFDYTYLEDRIKDLEESTFKIGALQAWPKYDINGVATDVPEDFHACDGTPIDPSLTELIEFIGPTYPSINYHIIRVRV